MDESALAELAARTCRPIPTGTPRLPGDAWRALLARLGPGWTVVGDRLRKTFPFPSFGSALAFVNQVGVIADDQDHHPDVHLAWGKAAIELWTHTVGGLSESDFIVAARIERAHRAGA
ncbi:MAG: 4a-hydroxytetrahydrobiopterin dehydratase [Kofleriaceae bacterium]|nr:4a-hydroxytetrahydrobiopterin dehydratase [Kofleriaceae bacterium]MCL4223272.1 4a-hydroxytetrahydrobiopterin dehydratase [Myxococcales bacterium]